MKTGKVILVGAGPGDPGLITLRGLRALQSAEVVVYDSLASPQLLDEAPVAAERINAGKQGAQHTLEQSDINALLYTKALEAKCVVRLKGGDPYVFGRGSEEAEYLVSRGIEVKVIPGIPAALGASAYAGIPLTDRRCTTSVTFVTGHEDPSKETSLLQWEALAKDTGTQVFYMGVKNLPLIAGKLVEHGKSAFTLVSIIERATRPEQRTVTGTLQTIAALADKAGVRPPALIIVGEVNRFHPALSWFSKQPLFGKRIVVTRSAAQAYSLSTALREAGAHVIEAAVIRIVPLKDNGPLDSAVQRLGRDHWVVFTSVNGVDAFFDRVYASNADARAFANIKIAAIGPATAERIRAKGLTPDFVPQKATSVSVFQELSEREEWMGKRLLLPRADIAPGELPENLRQAGAVVDEVDAYHTEAGDFDAETLKLEMEQGAMP